MQDEERGLRLALFLTLLPFYSVLLAKRQPCCFDYYSLHVTAPTARVCVMKQAGTNHIGLFKLGWSTLGCAIWPRDKSGESACTLAASCLRAPRHDPIGTVKRTRSWPCRSPNPPTGKWPNNIGKLWCEWPQQVA